MQFYEITKVSSLHHILESKNLRFPLNSLTGGGGGGGGNLKNKK